MSTTAKHTNTTPEQQTALVIWAKYWGRQWKARLREAWENAGDEARAVRIGEQEGFEYAQLKLLRNSPGFDLTKYRLPGQKKGTRRAKLEKLGPMSAAAARKWIEDNDAYRAGRIAKVEHVVSMGEQRFTRTSSSGRVYSHAALANDRGDWRDRSWHSRRDLVPADFLAVETQVTLHVRPAPEPKQESDYTDCPCNRIPCDCAPAASEAATGTIWDEILTEIRRVNEAAGETVFNPAVTQLVEEARDQPTALEAAAQRVVSARDELAEGEDFFEVTGAKPDQGFDDWAADVLDAGLNGRELPRADADDDA